MLTTVDYATMRAFSRTSCVRGRFPAFGGTCFLDAGAIAYVRDVRAARDRIQYNNKIVALHSYTIHKRSFGSLSAAYGSCIVSLYDLVSARLLGPLSNGLTRARERKDHLPAWKATNIPWNNKHWVRNM